MTGPAPWRLAVQYATRRETPARAQCRRWVAACRTCLAEPRPLILTLRFVDRAEQRRLNRDYRGRDYATNVLTFNYDEGEHLHADIVLCAPVVEDEARQQKKDLRAHYAHMVVHGVLHAHGFDHEKGRDAERMEALEVEILRRFRVPDPYR